MLRYRIASALILIPLILGSVYFGGLAFFAAVAVALLIAGYELFQMARHAGYRPMPVIGLALIALILLDAYWQSAWLRPLLTAALVVSLAVGIFRHGEGWLTGWAITLAGALYVGWIGAHFLLVRALPNGMQWTMATLVTAWAADTGAYAFGKRYGRHGFFTAVSPKKTWEGAIGGWVSATLMMLVIGQFSGLSVSVAHSLTFGFGIGIAAAAGDLAESLLKRQTGVKDSSDILPGHGGVLDRIDSLLFAAAFAYYYLVWVLCV